ncbi:MAG: tRNA uridine-5-carboxymethylaminomethyl(34) synthesis GTPase MnmE [Lachnospiraceae bacterium]
MNTNQTIAAIATAMSPAGISIIRISGEDALAIADTLYRSPNGKKKLVNQSTHTAHFGYIYDHDNCLIDEVLVLIMRNPKSYTGEDTVEIQCHGGILVTKKILEAVLGAGAKLAEPGEFTKRAFLNGKMDLAKAEAVMDMIHAKNQLALNNSVKQLRGDVSKAIAALRDQILDHVAFIEAALDDPEHISMDGYVDELLISAKNIASQLQHMIERADNGRRMVEGIRTAIIGKPNAGKSSLLNQLSGSERAIVTEVAGTTRDTLEEQVTIGDISFLLVDTAGIRDTEDIVEKIGVEKAKHAAAEADLVLYVADGTEPVSADDEEILGLLENTTKIILVNKADLQSPDASWMAYSSKCPVIVISAKEGSGLLELEEKLKEMFFQEELSMNDELLITNLRHKEALQEAYQSVNMAIDSMEAGMPEDFFTIDLMNAYQQLGYITGQDVEEDLVNRIFAKFCMGK